MRGATRGVFGDLFRIREEISKDLRRLIVPQHGNVTRRQLLALGIGDAVIHREAKHGRLHHEYPGVYSVGRPATTALERAAAAVLACGERAALSHFSALALWGWRKWGWRIDVTVVRDRRPKGIVVHLCRTLHRRDVRRHEGIRVTSPARTLLDCAPHLSERALTRAVNDALRSKNLKRWQLAEIVERCPLHPGAKLLKRFVGERGGPTRSGFEDEFKAFCERFDIACPQTNVVVNGYEVDAYFEKEKLIVELDGWDYHSSRDSFESDRNRDADELAMGLATVRITGDRIRNEPESEAARLKEIMRQRR